MEKTFIILKPDTVQRKLIGQIISRIENADLEINHIKMTTITHEQANEHYEHIRSLDIFEPMIQYITSAPAIMLIASGNNAIKNMRAMSGSVRDAAPGTIRGDHSCHGFMNLIHTSDSPESFASEAARFFPELKGQY